MQLVIALTGHARSGKDTAAAALVEDGWVRVGYADALKELALKANPWVDGSSDLGESHFASLAELVDSRGWDGAKQFKDVRHFLQGLGQGVREIVFKDAWVSVAHMRIADARREKKQVVVSDMRYLNEAETVRKFFPGSAFVVRITRPGVGPLNGHSSETELVDIVPDFTIDNDGSVADLQRRMRELVTTLQTVTAVVHGR